jgi:formylglycine-generating enzyme required for sulfatase activity
VKQRGIDFVADEEYFRTLQLAGADNTLIAALREASATVTAQLVVVTSPNAEVFLDGEFQGQASAQGELALKAKAGAHAMKVSLKGKKDFEQSVTLIAQQASKVEARLEDVPGAVRENPKDGLKYVWIPPGSFEMGCSPGDNECYDNEKPSHYVTIGRGFWMGQTDVTVGAYKRFAAAAGRQMPVAPPFNIGWANDNMPIVDVTWDDAHDYCTWAGGRLPTEAEWEYAARGGDTEARYGSLDEVAWYEANSGGQTQPVGEKRANGFGLYDVLGNVFQWVNDWFDPNYYQNSPSQNPSGPISGEQRVVRGGAWGFGPWGVRASNRGGLDPGGPASNVGFRCGGVVFKP